MLTARELLTRHEDASRKWNPFRSLWTEAGKYSLPQACNLMASPAEAASNQAQPNTVNLFDTTAPDANRRLAAGLYSYLFPVNERPFSVRATREEENEVEQIAVALSEMSSITQQQLANSNFPLEFFSFLEYFCCYGGACLYSERNRKPSASRLSFRNISMMNVVALYDEANAIDTVFNKFGMSPRQAAQRWGADALPPKMKERLGSPATMDNEMDVIHVVMPNEDARADRDDAGSKPFVAVYIGVEDKEFIGGVSGYQEMPYHIAWFWKASHEVAGRGPGTESLPEIRMLNAMRKTFIKAAEKQCDPPIWMPSEASVSPIYSQPGGINFHEPGVTKNDIWAMDTKADTRLTFEVLAEQSALVRRLFFNDLFQTLMDKTNITATQTVEIVEEKFRLLGPVVGRLQRGLFTPMIVRVLRLLNEDGAFASLGVEQIDFKVEYEGRLAMSVKELESMALVKLFDTFAGYAELHPEVFDNIGGADRAFRETARNFGVPMNWLVPIRERDAAREQRAQVQAAQMQAAQMQAMGAGMKDLGKPIDKSSPLGRIEGEA